MLTVIYAHKAGQGVTTITATLATLTARAGHRTLLIDTGTDLPAVLGIAEPDRPGLGDYLADTTITLADPAAAASRFIEQLIEDSATLPIPDHGLWARCFHPAHPLRTCPNSPSPRHPLNKGL